MADVKTIVRQMKDAGMSYPDILANLKELGIANAEEQLGKIAKELESEEKPPKREERRQAKTKPETTELRAGFHLGESETSVEKEKTADADSISEAPRRRTTGNEEKMDKIIALLKSLHELNVKILESNRDILTKLERRQTSGSNTSSELF